MHDDDDDIRYTNNLKQNSINKHRTHCANIQQDNLFTFNVQGTHKEHIASH